MKSQTKSLSHWLVGMGFEYVGIPTTHVICQIITMNGCVIATKLLQLKGQCFVSNCERLVEKHCALFNTMLGKYKALLVS